jgi:hypothetical protein
MRLEQKNKTLPARSSRPSHGEGEVGFLLSHGEGEVGFFTLPQGGLLRRNDEAGRALMIASLSRHVLR